MHRFFFLISRISQACLYSSDLNHRTSPCNPLSILTRCHSRRERGYSSLGFNLVQDAVIFCSARNRSDPLGIYSSVPAFIIFVTISENPLATCHQIFTSCCAPHSRSDVSHAMQKVVLYIHEQCFDRAALIRSGLQNRPEPAAL
jgi:hypothetical protein